MKKILSYLMLVLTFISFDSLGAVKKKSTNPMVKSYLLLMNTLPLFA